MEDCNGEEEDDLMVAAAAAQPGPRLGFFRAETGGEGRGGREEVDCTIQARGGRRVVGPKIGAPRPSSERGTPSVLQGTPSSPLIAVVVTSTSAGNGLHMREPACTPPRFADNGLVRVCGKARPRL